MTDYYDSALSPIVEEKKPIKKTNYSFGTIPNDTLFSGYFTNKNEPYFNFSTKSQEQLAPQKTMVKIPKVGNVSEPFSAKTKNLLYKVPHKTKLLDVAQEHLGIQEVTRTEYSKLSKAEQNNTQMHLIGKYGNVDHQWCAHTVSHLSEEAGINIDGHKNFVQDFINWGSNKGIYNSIKTNTATKNNYKTERKSREKQIKEQFKKMQEGDLIIWKSSYIAELPNGEKVEKIVSHIGIFESANDDGTISVIEGNANEFAQTDRNSERSIVKIQKEGIYGDQAIGDFKESNRRDGLIRKTYTPKNLASFGYSGYINMQSLVK